MHASDLDAPLLSAYAHHSLSSSGSVFFRQVPGLNGPAAPQRAHGRLRLCREMPGAVGLAASRVMPLNRTPAMRAL